MEGREWSGGPFRGPGVVERQSRRAGSDWEAIIESREAFLAGHEWSVGPPGGL